MESACDFNDCIKRDDFDALPALHRVRAYGVDYVQVTSPQGDIFYFTRYGWPWRQTLLPEHWYNDQQYARRGKRLIRSTGHVYRIMSAAKNPVDLVIKISRLAQDVPLAVADGADSFVSKTVLASANFNGPFEEIGLLMELRQGLFGPKDIRIRTKRPLMVYSPPQTFAQWELGRSTGQFTRLNQRLSKSSDGQPPVVLDIAREYVIVYAWLKGDNAEELFEQGLLNQYDLTKIAFDVMDDLVAKGFYVLDHKPNHVILRRRPDGSLLQRHGRWVYALADFELLKRTEPYTEYLRTKGATRL